VTIPVFFIIYLAITLHNFQLLSVVGTGGFGKVYKATLTKNRDLVALKVMSKVRVIQKKSVNSVMNELQILSSLKNEYIILMSLVSSLISLGLFRIDIIFIWLWTTLQEGIYVIISVDTGGSMSISQVVFLNFL